MPTWVWAEQKLRKSHRCVPFTATCCVMKWRLCWYKAHWRETIVGITPRWYRSHCGSRYKLGCCGHASLFLLPADRSPAGADSTSTQRRIKPNDPGRTRTCNLWFRGPTPYPLGHRAGCKTIITSNLRTLSPRRWHSRSPTRQTQAHRKRGPTCNDICNGSHSSAG